MSIGILKRNDLYPSPQIQISDVNGPVDLIEYSALMSMVYETILYEEMDNSQVVLKMPAGLEDIIETGDGLIIEREYLVITGTPTLPITSSYVEFNVSRGQTIPGTKLKYIPPFAVEGLGSNRWCLSANCVFTIDMNFASSSISQQITLAKADHAANTAISDIIDDLNAKIDATPLLNYLEAVAVNNKIIIQDIQATPVSTTRLRIHSINQPALEELGFYERSCSCIGNQGTIARGHYASTPISIIKFRNNAFIKYPSKQGNIAYEWEAGQTDREGTFQLEFEVMNDDGLQYIISGGSIQIAADADRL